ncbi:MULTISPECIES: tyrosine--tRNA ligase [Chromobacterium]|uniref:tyrosine--tRNA ligase n=1 Tax=Chromobacterium TaxID=535 RepID=UPI001D0667B5|nr:MULTISPECIES: tyrosine--tRNA ligase [Chromobacterium]MCP1289169.1 tyrosine--tRNA ligase [Chromobacterium sp. S0633]UJB33702.1 tyrosine--tRNA ligase [Chromobacterium sp. Beijing]
MKQSTLIRDLQQRGLISQATDADALDALLSRETVTLYCGFDPTADSLHLGHLVPLLLLKRFQMAGHRPIALVGGATGMIGDPSFKASERKLNTSDVVAGWVDKIRRQVEPFLSFEGDNAALMANNHDWFAQMSALDFLRDVGKHFSVNAMIKKESVQQRINRDDVGISFTEFAYSLLQSHDFVELNRRFGCKLQIGGSDQWGNITAGVDLVRRVTQQQAFGLTMPLITNSDGTKFGKSEGNAVWLDPSKCSPYAFYQFWLGAADADVYRFLRYFTFLSNEEIEVIEAEDRASGGKPRAQRILAEQVTELVHGPAALAAAQRITLSLFDNDVERLGAADFAQLAQDGMPRLALPRQSTPLVDALAASGLAASKSEARTLLQSGAVSVNGARADALDARLEQADHLHQRYTLLRRGKKQYCLLIWE